ncbi:DUF397 domain-containing protein [Streptomyces sp. LBUM 1476]|nr:DUF397 domain-containing protein [Streptomyces sp. LBUM 1476]MBZ3914605.1 DUF397 domain-containing protein [Streptomyces acidiscabies]
MVQQPDLAISPALDVVDEVRKIVRSAPVGVVTDHAFRLSQGVTLAPGRLISHLLQAPAYTEAVVREQRPDKADRSSLTARLHGCERSSPHRHRKPTSRCRYHPGGLDQLGPARPLRHPRLPRTRRDRCRLRGRPDRHRPLRGTGPGGNLHHPVPPPQLGSSSRRRIHGTYPPRHTGNGRRLLITHFPNAAATGFDWFKSSHSSGDQSCLETAAAPGIIPVQTARTRTVPHSYSLLRHGFFR